MSATGSSLTSLKGSPSKQLSRLLRSLNSENDAVRRAAGSSVAVVLSEQMRDYFQLRPDQFLLEAFNQLWTVCCNLQWNVRIAGSTALRQTLELLADWQADDYSLCEQQQHRQVKVSLKFAPFNAQSIFDGLDAIGSRELNYDGFILAAASSDLFKLKTPLSESDLAGQKTNIKQFLGIDRSELYGLGSSQIISTTDQELTEELKRGGSADNESPGPEKKARLVFSHFGQAGHSSNSIDYNIDTTNAIEWYFISAVQGKIIEELFNPVWTIRHGACLCLDAFLHAVTGLKRSPVSPAPWIRLIDMIGTAIVKVLAFDRFNDFVVDETMAPVRQVAAQCLKRIVCWLDKFNGKADHLLKAILSCINQMVNYWSNWQVQFGGLLALDTILGDCQEACARCQMSFQELYANLMKIILESDHQSSRSDDIVGIASRLQVKLLEKDLLGQPITAVEQLRKDYKRISEFLFNSTDELAASTGQLLRLITCLKSADNQFLFEILPVYFFHDISSVRAAALDCFSAGQEMLNLKDCSLSTPLLLLLGAVLYEPQMQLRSEGSRVCAGFISRLAAAKSPNGPVDRADLVDFFNVIAQSNVYRLDGSNLQFMVEKSGHAERLLQSIKRFLSTQHPSSTDVSAGLIDESTLPARLSLIDLFAKVLLLYSDDFVCDFLHNGVVFYRKSESAFTHFSVLYLYSAVLRNSTRRDLPLDLLDESVEAVVSLKKCLEPPTWVYHESQVHISQLVDQLNGFARVCKSPSYGFSREAKLILSASTDFNSLLYRSELSDCLQLMKASLSQRSSQRLNDFSKQLNSVMDAVDSLQSLHMRWLSRIQCSAAYCLLHNSDRLEKLTPIIRPAMDVINTETQESLRSLAGDTLSLLVPVALQRRPCPLSKIVSNLCKFSSHAEQLSCYIASLDDNGDSGGETPMEITNKTGVLTTSSRQLAVDNFLSLNARAVLVQLISEHRSSILPIVIDTVRSCFNQQATGGPTGVPVDFLIGLRVVHCLAEHGFLTDDASVSALVDELFRQLSSQFTLIRYLSASCIKHLILRCSSPLNNGVLFRTCRHVLAADKDAETDLLGAIEAVAQIVTGWVDGVDQLPNALAILCVFLRLMLTLCSTQSEAIRLAANICFAELVEALQLSTATDLDSVKIVDLNENADVEHELRESVGFVATLFNPQSRIKFQLSPLILKKNVVLRPYQNEGIDWLAFIRRNGFGGILADDLGVGKTLQTLCAIVSDWHSTDLQRKPSLVLCPAALIEHWQHELNTFFELDKIGYSVVVVSGRQQQLRIFNDFQNQRINYSLYVVSNDVFKRNFQPFSNVRWAYCVLDEAHALRNPQSKLSIALRSVVSDHRLLLTGTPVQNTPLDLWALFDFLMPGYLGSRKWFQRQFVKPVLQTRSEKCTQSDLDKANGVLASLHRRTLPFILRRLKQDVLNDLPAKQIQDYFCTMTDLQRRLYALLESEWHTSRQSQSTSDRPSKAAALLFTQRVQKLCNHPVLAFPQGWNDPSVRNEFSKEKGAADKTSRFDDLQHSAKLLLLRQLLCDIFTPNAKSPEKANEDNLLLLGETSATGRRQRHRALIFCQTRASLDLVERLLSSAFNNDGHLSWLRVDLASDAFSIAQLFNNDQSVDLLLLTSSVGGQGLNLTGADVVIFFELDWNPAKDLQAMDRAHRIGQSRHVTVYRLITTDSVEQHVAELQRAKQGTIDALVNRDNAALESLFSEDNVVDLVLSSGVERSPATRTTSGDQLDLIVKQYSDAKRLTGNI